LSTVDFNLYKLSTVDFNLYKLSTGTGNWSSWSLWES
jgi:hypothetical protein